ncbi:MAG: GumC family protein [Planctomycetota bacterium]|jgi:capsular exopolysaccharide synthesis family protein
MLENGTTAEGLPAGAEPAEVNLRDYLRIIVKHIWVILVFFVIVVAAVALHTLRQPKIYRATSRVNIRREVPELSQLQSLWNFWSTQQEYMETQYKILVSRKIARKAVIKLGLAKGNPPIATVVNFQKGIIVEPVKDTFLVDVSFEGADPVAVAKYVDTIVEVYMDSHKLEKDSQSIEAENTIKKEMPKIVKKLEEAERNYRAYQEKNNLLSFEESKARLNRNLDAIVDDIQRLAKELLDVGVKKKRIDEAREKGDVRTLPLVQESRLVNDLKIQISRLNEQHIELKSEYKTGGRKITALTDKITEKQGELQREIELITTGIVETYEDLRDKLDKRLADKKEASDALNSLEKMKFTWDRLKNEVEQQRKIYDEATAKMKEIAYASGVSMNEITVIDSATEPKIPVKPKPLLNLTMAAVVGLLGGIGLAFFFEYLDDTIKGPEDVERYLKTPLLGIIPSFGKGEDEPKRDLKTFYDPKSTISEVFRSIRTGILFSSPDREPATLLVWSAGSSEGKTLVTINMAVAMAQAGARVVIVDGDLRRPRMHNAFHVEAEDGLSNFLTGQKDLSDLLVKTDVENLTVLPAGPTPPNPSELLGADRMKNLLKLLGERFDKVLIDSPPAMIVTDAAVLASIVDGMVQVVSASKVSRKILARALDQMAKVGGRNLGAILNKVKSKKSGYDYYAGYYYYGYYGYKK